MVTSKVGRLCMVNMVVGAWEFHDCSLSLGLLKWYACGAGFYWVERLTVELRNLFQCQKSGSRTFMNYRTLAPKKLNDPGQIRQFDHQSSDCQQVKIKFVVSARGYRGYILSHQSVRDTQQPWQALLPFVDHLWINAYWLVTMRTFLSFLVS